MTNIPVKQYIRLLGRYLRPQAGRALLAGIFLLASIALRLAYPQVLGRFIDTVQAGGELQTLLHLAGLFLLLAAGQQVVGVVATYFSENVGWTATNALRNDLAAHCLRLDLSFHNTHSPGEMIERIDGDVTALANFFSLFTVQILGNSLLMAGVVVMLFVQDWRVGLPVGLFAALALWVMLRSRNLAVPHFAGERQASAELFGFLEERMGGTEDIRANGAKAYVMRRFFELMRALMQKSLKAALMINILLNLMWFLFAVGVALAFALGAYLFSHQAVTIGAVYVIFQYTDMLNQPISDIVHQLGDLQRAGAGIGRLSELLQEKSKLQEALPGAGRTLERETDGRLGVEFSRVSFGYDDQPGEKERVLHGISFALQPGQVLGVLGRTGSGKTSLTRLLFRLYDPDEGVVRLAGDSTALDLRELPLAWIHRRVGMVTQNIQLFRASVRDNLTFFDRSIPDDRILQVLQDLGLWSWFCGLPAGLDSLLASGDGGLSAGEGQLLAFVRIFLRDPSIVVLDEASSRLDPATGRRIEAAIDRLLENRTAIIVAHRLGTVQRASHILILEDGRVCEYGPRLELLQNPASRFSALMRTGMEEVLV